MNKHRYILFVIVALVTACVSTAQIGTWKAPDFAVNNVNPVTYDVDSVMTGKALFEKHCQRCHGYWGEGNGVIGAALDKKPANLLRIAGKKAEGEFAWKIAEGRGDMPAFRQVLSEEEIWHIVNFVESLENEEGGQPVAKQISP